MAHVPDRGQTEANGVAVRREVRVTDIDIWWFDSDSRFAAFVDVLHDIVGVARDRG